MPDEITQTGTVTNPAETGKTPATQPDASAPANGANGNGGAATPPTADALQQQIKELQGALKKANGEAAGNRKKLEAYETDERKRQEAALTETEKAQKRVTELEQQLGETQAKVTAHERRLEFRKASGKLKLTWANPQAEDDAFALSGLGGQADADVDAAVKALVKERPYLLQTAAPPPDINAGDRPNGQPPVVPQEEQAELAKVYGVDPAHFKLKASK